MKVIAFYLPQFHPIPENDDWWGEGFTEWVNVKKAKPLFQGHNQPRIPLNRNYYNLLDNKVKAWQIEIAKQHGIYGFCYYHYWFDGHMLLHRPLEQMLAEKNLEFPFCICWANEDWTKAWVSKSDEILIGQTYGEKDEWERHFNYLLPFFKDERYIKNNGKPLFVIYRPEIINCLNDMLDFWQVLAKKNGIKGIEFAYQAPTMDYLRNKDDSRFTYNIEAQPIYARMELGLRKNKLLKSVFTNMNSSFKHYFFKMRGTNLTKRDYDKTWRVILEMRPKSEKSIPGAFVDFDNTPRRGDKGSLYMGVTPEKFEEYFTKQLIRAKEVYKKEMIFIFAWNEWAESGYLEPDEKNGYAFLEAIRRALKSQNEFPVYPGN